jgi:chitin disaccharide deacetylase
MVKNLVINADDFGLTEGINRGIVDAFQNGIVTSTSLLATMPAFHHAAELALKNHLDIGAHISLTLGTPCTGKGSLAPILRDGQFIDSYRNLFMNIYRGRIKREDLEYEIECQIAKIEKNGLRINHINGHQHILMLPSLLKTIFSLMKKHEIPFLRVPAEIIKVSSLRSHKGWAFLVLGVLSKYAKFRLNLAGSTLRTSTCFHGLAFSERMSLKDLMGVLKSVKPGITEIQCHPGYWDKDFLPAYCQGPFMRDQELEVLKSIEVINGIAEKNIRLTGYGKLASELSCKVNSAIA